MRREAKPVFQVALCEDEKIFAETHEEICRDILGRMNIEFNVTVFGSGGEFLADFADNGHRYNLILLDIVMDGLNGMETAKRIRAADKDVDIVFITSSPDYVFSGYDVRALHYLIKPVDAGILERLIKSVYEEKYRSHYFLLKSGAQNLRIAVKDVISLEAFGRKVEITTADGMFQYAGKLTELLGELPDGYFVRCHQSCAVSIGKIREIDRFEAVAVNGKRIPISRQYFKAVQAALLLNIPGQ
jgi:DNA-binding LytR/AlgR family response regulator